MLKTTVAIYYDACFNVISPIVRLRCSYNFSYQKSLVSQKRKKKNLQTFEKHTKHVAGVKYSQQYLMTGLGR